MTSSLPRARAPAIVAIPIFFLFRNAGLLDTIWALMLIYAAVNLSVAQRAIEFRRGDLDLSNHDPVRVHDAPDRERRVDDGDQQRRVSGRQSEQVQYVDREDDTEQQKAEPRPQIDASQQPPRNAVAPDLMDQPPGGRPDEQHQQFGGVQTQFGQDQSRCRELGVAKDQVVDGDDDEQAAHAGHSLRSLEQGWRFSRRWDGV